LAVLMAVVSSKLFLGQGALPLQSGSGLGTDGRAGPAVIHWQVGGS
jgi:hypothetical protein